MKRFERYKNQKLLLKHIIQICTNKNIVFQSTFQSSLNAAICYSGSLFKSLGESQKQIL